MSTTVSITPVDLTSAERVAPVNGPLSSSDYNESTLEILSDLATIASFINQVALPLLSTLAAAAQQPTQQPVGIQGSTIFTDTSDATPLFLDPATGQPLVIADSLRSVSGMLDTYTTQLNDLQVQVQTLQQRISSSSLNDVALTLQNFGESLSTLNGAVKSVQSQITTLSNGAAKVQVTRVVTGSITVASVGSVTVDWPTPYVDDNYTVTGLALEEATSDLEIVGFTRITGGAGITVLVQNSNQSTAFSGTVHASACHD